MRDVEPDPDERLLARAINGSYNPDAHNYLNSIWPDDPFRYQISKRYRVSNILTGETLHFELYGRPVALLSNWREKMAARGETMFAKVRSGNHDFKANYLNTEDPDDPYIYELLRVERWKRGSLVWHQFYGRAVDIKDEWKKVIKAAGGNADTGYKHKQKAAPVETLYAVLGVQVGADKVTIRRAYRTLAFELHPDRNPAADATQRFQEVQSAYERLLAL